MKNQALFFSKDKSKKLKCRLLQFLFGALRINIETEIYANKICSDFFVSVFRFLHRMCHRAHFKDHNKKLDEAALLSIRIYP